MTFAIEEHLEVVTTMVQEAGSLSLQWFRGPLEVENKEEGLAGDRFDPVTAADRAVEDHLRARLHEAFPDHQVMGEEGGVTGSGDHRWVIDPIDGTRAFITGQPLWGTILGLQRGREVLAGWMYQPALGHTYVASPASGWLETNVGRTPLGTSSVTALAEAVVLSTHPSMFAEPADLKAWTAVESRARLTRFGGDCINYGYVATGFADVVIDNELQPYDIIPLIPIIERAGGVITGREGEPAIDGGWAIAAATPELHREVLEALAAG